MKKLSSLCLLFCAVFLNAAPQVKDLTLDQAIGQTLVVRIDVGDQAKYEQAVKDGLMGTVLIKGGSLDAGNEAQKRAATLQTIADLRKWEKLSPHQIPLLIAFDYEGGAVVSPMFLGLTQMPSNMLMSASCAGKDAIYNMFRANALEVKSMDGQINFSPALDVNTNPQNPIIGTRSFGSDSQQVTQHGVEAFKGLQKEKVAAFAKHFPGHGDTVVDSHIGSPVMNLSWKDLEKDHIAPFKTAIKKGIWGIMSSHVVYPALDPKNTATFSRKILTDYLRGDLKFKGVIASDSLDMEGAKLPGGIAQAAAKSMAAGVDMPLIGKELPYDSIAYIKKEMGHSLTEKEIKTSVQRVLDLKKKTGLLKSYKQKRSVQPFFEQTAQKIAKGGVTLFKNEAQIIPAQTDNKSVCGVFFSEPILKNQIQSILTPFQKSGWKTEWVYAEQTPSAKTLQSAQACAKDKGLLIITSTQKYNEPDAEQKKIITALLTEYPQAVLISALSPYDIAFYPQAKTVLAVYGATPQVMQAAGDVILGQQKACGHMPTAL